MIAAQSLYGGFKSWREDAPHGECHKSRSDLWFNNEERFFARPFGGIRLKALLRKWLRMTRPFVILKE